MDKDTILKFLRQRDKSGNSLIRIIDVKYLDEIADFIEQQEKQIKEQSESAALWMDIAIRYKNTEKRQAEQINKMKRCSNCKHENSFTGCGRNACVDYKDLEWDGGSGDN